MADNGGSPFWGNQGKIAEPKRQSKWVLVSTRFGPIWIIKAAKKPSFEVTEIVVPFVNHEFYYPGRVKWSETDITIIDVIDPDSADGDLRGAGNEDKGKGECTVGIIAKATGSDSVYP